jgi:CTP:phosphocholine cytidylyltransferase-like protein
MATEGGGILADVADTFLQGIATIVDMDVKLVKNIFKDQVQFSFYNTSRRLLLA